MSFTLNPIVSDSCEELKALEFRGVLLQSAPQKVLVMCGGGTFACFNAVFNTTRQAYEILCAIGV